MEIILPEHLQDQGQTKKEESRYTISQAWRVFRHYLAQRLINSGKGLEDFDTSGNYEKIYQNLFLHFFKDGRSEFPLSKGVYLFGYKGVGKSMLMKALVEAYNYCNMERDYRYCNTKVLSDKVSSSKDVSIIDKYCAGGLVLDDLAREGKASAYHYNDRVVSSIINTRYERTLYNNTYITTNADFGKEVDRRFLSEMYGDHIMSRFTEMFTFVKLKGKNNRV